MILIDPKGLLWGKRLRKVCLKARLYYPLILGLTNFYARIELDEPFILSNFTSFKDADLTDENLTRWCNEYQEAGLAFLYKTATQTWIQFDTPVAMRKSYPTAEDNSSPAPPQGEYEEWLKSLHGDKWEEYDLSKYQRTLSEKRSEAGKSGGKASGEARRSKTNGASADEPVVVVGAGVGVGVVDEDGEGDEVEASRQELKLKPEAVTNKTSTNSSKSQDGTAASKSNAVVTPKASGATSTVETASPISAPPPQQQVDDLVRIWETLMQFNPKDEPEKRPKGWEKMWSRDFRALLSFYDVDTVYRMIAYTQSEKQQQYYIRPEVLLNRRETVLEDVKYRMEHNPKQWDAIWDSYLKMLGLQPEPKELLTIQENDLSAFMKITTCTNCGEAAVDCDCNYQCPRCDATYASVLTIQAHILSDHPVEEHPQELVTFNIEGDDDELA